MSGEVSRQISRRKDHVTLNQGCVAVYHIGMVYGPKFMVHLSLLGLCLDDQSILRP